MEKQQLIEEVLKHLTDAEVFERRKGTSVIGHFPSLVLSAVIAAASATATIRIHEERLLTHEERIDTCEKDVKVLIEKELNRRQAEDEERLFQRLQQQYGNRHETSER